MKPLQCSRNCAVLTVWLWGIFSFVPCYSQSSPGFDQKQSSMNNGGGRQDSATMSEQGAVGQIVIGSSSSTNYINLGGFGYSFFTPPQGLVVSPPIALNSSGMVGGPFAPANRAYTLSNTSSSSINWSVSIDQSWLGLSATVGTLVPGNSATVVVTINSSAAILPAGNYAGTVQFINTTSGTGNTSRPANLSISYAPIVASTAGSGGGHGGGGCYTTAPPHEEDFHSGTLLLLVLVIVSCRALRAARR